MKSLLLVLALLLASTPLLAQQPVPQIYLTANNSQFVYLFPGWPLIVHTTIMNSLRYSNSPNLPPLVISPTGEPWTSAVQFTAVSSSGQAVTWPLQLVGVPASPALTLQSTDNVTFAVEISPADVSSLPPDTYQLTATLQVSNSPGWNGTVRTRPVTITVGPEPQLDPVLQSNKAGLIAEYQVNAGDINGAFATAQQLLQAQPGDVKGMTAAAALLESASYSQLAFFQASDALDTFYTANSDAPEAPFELLTMYRRLWTYMMTPDSTLQQTSISASSASIVFSPNPQNVALSAVVSSPVTTVDGGTVTFVVPGVSAPVNSSTVSGGNATVSYAIPGGQKAGTYSIRAVYNGTATLSPSTDVSQSLTIHSAMPTITWNTPTSIASGTALGNSQLNATASVPGTFVYNPPAGTVLPSATTQTLSVTFMPADANDYNSATASVSVTVLGGTYSGSVSPTSATVPVGSSQTFNITVNSSTFDGLVSLTCANPPKGITCQFQPSQLNLSPNASSSTMLKVTVSAKPAALVVQPPAGRSNKLPSLRLMIILLTMAILVLVLCLTVRELQRVEFGQRRLGLVRLSLALLLFASFHMAACVSASLTGQGPAKNGGGGGAAPANVILTIQGTSGANAANITTLSITVP